MNAFTQPALTMFEITTYGVLAPWALLIFLPGWRWTDRLVHSAIVPGLLAFVYAWLYANGAFAASASEDSGFPSLIALQQTLGTPAGALAAWVHYLAFDLFVGAWIARDARRRDIGHLLVIPCLVFTLLAGPIGLLLYFIIRPATGRGGLSVRESSAGAV